jgi:hypothetical protein
MRAILYADTDQQNSLSQTPEEVDELPAAA